MIAMEDDRDRELKIITLKCLRCGHEWTPRKATLPRTCPNCGSPYWDRPRKEKKKKSDAGKLIFPDVPCCKADIKENE